MVISFINIFFRMAWHIRGVFLAILALTMVGAVVIAGVEKIPIAEAVYFALITGLSIGYGDVVATTLIAALRVTFNVASGCPREATKETQAVGFSAVAQEEWP